VISGRKGCGSVGIEGNRTIAPSRAGFNGRKSPK
jgi:hypothetical protein